MAVVLALGSWLMLSEGPSHGAFAADSVHAGASADLRAPPSAGPRRFEEDSGSLGGQAIHANDRVAVARPEALVHGAAGPPLASSSRTPSHGSLPSAALAHPSIPNPAPEPSSKPLTDRTGGREQLVAAIQADFMPLADECIEQAKRRRPELTGDLVFGIETVADDENGGVIEIVEWQPHNQIDDPELLECIEESALTMNLPADDYGDPFELHLKVE